MRSSRIAAVSAAVAVVAGLSGCTAGSSNPPAGTSPSAVVDAFAIGQDFPDPDVLLVGGTYHAYATNSGDINVQTATSTDLKTWKVSGEDALPELPAWAEAGNTWAPDVSEASPGHFVMYFAAKLAGDRYQCIGVATADDPSGPFVGEDKPLICPRDEGGAIDPDSFVDSDGARYLVWKNDGNCCGKQIWLQATPVSADGLTVTGPAIRLVSLSEDWEGRVIEAPTLIRHDDEYVLFYSANDYAGSKYAIGYATAPALAGPYTKVPGPWFATDPDTLRYLGPGGQDVIVDKDGGYDLVFHSWLIAGDGRGMNVLPLEWQDGKPVVRP